jgi:hypothetical protein
MTGIEGAIAVGLISAASSAVIASEAEDARNRSIRKAAEQERTTNRALARKSASSSRAALARQFDAMAGAGRVASAETGTAGSQSAKARTTSLFGDSEYQLGNVNQNLFNTQASLDTRRFNSYLSQGNSGLAAVQGGMAGLQMGLSLYQGAQNIANNNPAPAWQGTPYAP